MHDFDREYWERHWGDGAAAHPANPYVDAHTADLAPGTALDAGSGVGAEAIALAERGWTVTGADISRHALDAAARRAADAGVTVRWLRADLTSWEPATPFDLVMTHYAHAPGGQLAFYRRIAGWVAPGGTLLIVAHRSHADPAHPDAASADVDAIVGDLDPALWRVDAAGRHTRTIGAHTLHDVVVRAARID